MHKLASVAKLSMSVVYSPQKLLHHPFDLRRGGGGWLMEHERKGALIQGGLGFKVVEHAEARHARE